MTLADFVEVVPSAAVVFYFGVRSLQMSFVCACRIWEIGTYTAWAGQALVPMWCPDTSRAPTSRSFDTNWYESGRSNTGR